MLAAGHGKNVVTSPWHLRFVPSSESQPGSWDRRISRSKSPCRRLNQQQHASLAGYHDTTTKLNCDTNTASSTSSKNINKISKDIKGMLHKDRKNMQLSATMSIDVSIFCSICWCWPWSEQLPILKIYSTLPLFAARVDRRANRIGTYRHQDFSSTRTQRSEIFYFISQYACIISNISSSLSNPRMRKIQVANPSASKASQQAASDRQEYWVLWPAVGYPTVHVPSRSAPSRYVWNVLKCYNTAMNHTRSCKYRYNRPTQSS